MRMLLFADRNRKELMREPLGWIFCLGFPLIMLAIMTVVNESIPKEANMLIFRIDYLAGGIAIFGLTFIMLFASLQISRDRSGAFLLRLYASPMSAADFMAGYVLPLFLIALVQILIAFVVAYLLSIMLGVTMWAVRLLLAVLVCVPAMIFFISIGLLFGTLCNDKAAPGLSSIFITVSAMLGGVWMDVEALGGGLKTVCQCLPFYHMVQAERKTILGEYDAVWPHLLPVIGYTAAAMLLAVFVFSAVRRNDLK